MRAWFVWSLAALAFGYAFFQRVMPSVMVPDLMAEFAIGGAMLGTLSALYFYPYVLLQVPLGALLDRLGARLLLTGALSLAALGTMLFAIAQTLEAAYAGRVLIGIGSAVGFLGALSLAGTWFEPRRFAFLAGLIMFTGMMSGVLAQAPLALFVEKFGWRTSVWTLGGFGAVLALMIFVFVRDSPQPKGQEKERPVESWRSIWEGLLRAASSWTVWKIALVAAAMSGPMLALAALWGTPFMMSAYDLPRPQAAFFASLMLIGWAFGAPFAGWLSDRLGKRKQLIVGGVAVQTLALAPLALIPDLPLFLTVILLVIAGGFGGAMAVSFALVREVTPPQISGSVSGIVNGMTVASGAVLQPLVGVVLDLVWDGEMLNGSRFYQASDYRTAFLLVLASAALGFLLSLKLPNK